MVLTFQKKKEIIAEINYTAKKALSIVVANPKGISANDITRLRKSARKLNIKLGVFRNTLFYLGIKGTNFECIKNVLKGPVLIAYSLKHPASAARLFRDFYTSNLNSNLQIIGAVFEGKLISGENINILADIPTFEEILHRFIIVMQEISVGKLLRALISIKNKKENI